VTDLQIQAKALGDPTRHRIFRYVADADEPVDVATLTSHLGLNHNAIRQHLTQLVAAGLLTEGVAPPAGRGRPRLEYRLDPAADSRWGITGPYERLAMLLAEIVRTGDEPLEVGRRAGHRQHLGHRAISNDPVAAFAEVMDRQGFDPVVDDAAHRGEADSEEVVVTLRTCPFTSAVLTDADTVCDLHLGLARGVAEAVGGLEVDALVRQDPRTAACTLRCRVTGDPDAG
jgi:predicted ArsR family transcriptional regulator